MKRESADGQNESTETPWASVLRITSSDEFRQSFAVAQLAVKLCELKMATLKLTPTEKENLDPLKFLAEAWKLIESAHGHVLRRQSDAEYLQSQHGSHEAAENVLERILSVSRVPFKKLCDPNYETKDHDVKPIELFDAQTGMTLEIPWKVYRSERGLDDLFWAYWHETSILKLRMIVSPEAPGNAPDKWEEYGKQKLASWRRDGVPPNDFLAFAKFRREHDKRAANLKKKPKRKRRRLMAKARA